MVIVQIWKLRNVARSKLTNISPLKLPVKVLQDIESLAQSRPEQPTKWQKPSCKYIQKIRGRILGFWFVNILEDA